MDGQDGGNDYYRGTCSYTTVLPDISLPETDVPFCSLTPLP